ncbi:hypothetical protein HID58_074225 [Brassica napus]|uniref:Uncharacterized protein n=2 Tax=Brassica napus TaxID=3708 RepID=A0ABQ7YGD8_BRANA|nr:hypothetical protein HID58_074225 [Brassica napus]CDY25158.1 BnaC07g03490D [Brassica napus]
MVEKESFYLEEKELSSGEGSGASEKPLGEDLLQLEEGEIREVSRAGDSKSLAIKVVDLNLRFDEDKSLWLTKHSKNYRRALRQMALW